MSVYKNYYVIAGYDITGCTTDKYDEWEWSEEWEELTSNQVKGNIQLFTDPMSGNYLYIGYILAAGDEFEFETVQIDLSKIESKEIMCKVSYKLNNLINAGFIEWRHKPFDGYKIIVFEECT